MAHQRPLRNLSILGVHPVHISPADFDKEVEMQWGEGLSGAALKRARTCTREHYDTLRLIEVQLDPPDAEIAWDQITQPRAGQPRDNWQVAYDEQPIDKSTGRWAFFLHSVDFTGPLLTPVGDRPLPDTTPCLLHLQSVPYDPPG